MHTKYKKIIHVINRSVFFSLNPFISILISSIKTIWYVNITSHFNIIHITILFTRKCKFLSLKCKKKTMYCTYIYLYVSETMFIALKCNNCCTLKWKKYVKTDCHIYLLQKPLNQTIDNATHFKKLIQFIKYWIIIFWC